MTELRTLIFGIEFVAPLSPNFFLQAQSQWRFNTMNAGIFRAFLLIMHLI
jgi:hypothetical protein